MFRRWLAKNLARLRVGYPDEVAVTSERESREEHKFYWSGITDVQEIPDLPITDLAMTLGGHRAAENAAEAAACRAAKFETIPYASVTKDGRSHVMAVIKGHGVVVERPALGGPTSGARSTEIFLVPDAPEIYHHTGAHF